MQNILPIFNFIEKGSIKVDRSKFNFTRKGNPLVMLSVCLILYLSASLANAQSPGNALDFDGSNDYVNAGNHSAINMTNAITVEAWFNKDASGGFAPLVFNGGGWGNNGFQLYANTVKVGVEIKGSAVKNISTPISTNQWYHVAFTWDDATDQLNLYLNGSLATSTTMPGPLSVYNSNMLLGAYLGGSQAYYNGMLDEVRIWDHSRSACEISGFMNTDFTGSESGLKAYYKFNHGTAAGSNGGATSLTEISGNSSNGLLTNFSLSGSSSNWLSSGATIDNNNLVADSTKPILVCKVDTVYLDASGNATIDSSDVTSSFSDNCGIASVALSNESFSCETEVTLVAEQPYNGSIIGGYEIGCGQSFKADSTGVVSKLMFYGIYNGGFGGGSASFQVNIGAGNNPETATVLGTETVHFNTVLQYYEVDFSSIIQITADSDYVWWVDGGDPSKAYISGINFDNYSDGTFWQITSSGATAVPAKDATFKIVMGNSTIVTAIDHSGNTTVCESEVFVLDTIRPTVICQNNTVYIGNDGTVTVTEVDIDGGSFDNCSLLLTTNNATFDCSDLGDHNFTLYGYDYYNNVSSCSAVVSVVDTINHLNVQYFSDCDSMQVNGTWYFSSVGFNDTLFGGAANGCDSINQYNITINYSPTDLVNPSSISEDTVCRGSEAEITLSSSDVGTFYFLRNQGDSTNLTGPVTGTGGAILLTTPAVVANTVFEVYAHNGICDRTMTDTAEVRIIFPATFAQSIIDCDSSLVNGNTYYTSQVILDTLPGAAANGCDSIVTTTLTINYTQTGADAITSCDSIMVNGNMYYTSQIVRDTLTGASSNGCDSIAATTLTINYTQSAVDAITSCDSALVNGTMFYTSQVIIDTLGGASANGCDSVVTTTLTINYTQIGTDAITSCDSSMVNGTTYYTSQVIIDTLSGASANGCDSVVTTTLTINYTQQGSDAITTCDSALVNGTMYYTSQVINYTLSGASANGCDSMITVNLDINHTSTTPVIETACGSYIFGGDTITVSGIYNDTLISSEGCDSIILLDLTILNVDVSVFVNGTLLNAVDGAQYQWLDCDNDYAELVGEIDGTYTATASGNYAVQVTKENCVDTSECISILIEGIVSLHNSDIKVYPNPTNGAFALQLPSDQFFTIEIRNVMGQLVARQELANGTTNFTISGDAGIYLIHVIGDHFTGVKTIIKQQ